jgi:hypothetical protein
LNITGNKIFENLNKKDLSQWDIFFYSGLYNSSVKILLKLCGFQIQGKRGQKRRGSGVGERTDKK